MRRSLFVTGLMVTGIMSGAMAKATASNPLNQFPRGFRALTGEEIKATLSGKTIVPDPKLNNAPLEYGEIFAVNGDWRGSSAMRGLRVDNGRWTVENGALCIVPSRSDKFFPTPKVCRQVWRYAANGRIALNYYNGRRTRRVEDASARSTNTLSFLVIRKVADVKGGRT